MACRETRLRGTRYRTQAGLLGFLWLSTSWGLASKNFDGMARSVGISNVCVWRHTAPSSRLFARKQKSKVKLPFVLSLVLVPGLCCVIALC